jgi:hypothetical protein
MASCFVEKNPVPEPEILACYRAPDGHVADLWAESWQPFQLDYVNPPAPEPETRERWYVGNDDRSVVANGATADDALDAYLRALEIARFMLEGDDTDPDELELTSAPAGADIFAGPVDFPDNATFHVGHMGAFRTACARAAEGGELDLSGCNITPGDRS